MKELNILTDYGKIDIWVIEEFERQVKHSLPNTYKKLLSRHNGLTYVEDAFDYIDYNGIKDTSGIGFESFSWDGKSGIQVSQEYVSKKINYGLPGLISFGLTGGGDYICFDYRDNAKTNEPKIILMYHDEYIEHEDGSATMVINFVANTFDEFIGMLYKS